jgi:hypothetical protein
MPENPNRVEIARRVEKARSLAKGKTAEALAEYLLVLQTIRPTTMFARWPPTCAFPHKGGQAVILLGELFERQVAAMDATRASLT